MPLSRESTISVLALEVKRIRSSVCMIEQSKLVRCLNYTSL